jgi:hypothetical protein
MSKFRNRLFDIVDDEPVINALIINIGPFNKLYLLDKDENKSKYISQLQYCYYVGDYDSPLYNMEKDEQILEACNLCFGSGNVSRHVTKALEAAVALYIKCQSTVEKRTLEGCKLALDALNKNLANTKRSSSLLTDLLLDIDSAIKKETDLDIRMELFGSKQELEQKALANDKAMSDLVVRSSKVLDTINELTEKANKSHSLAEDILGSYMIDELLTKRELKDF